MSTRYFTAQREFRKRYLLGAVLQFDGSFRRAAEWVGVDVTYLRATLATSGIHAQQVQEMLVNRELLRQGMPPRKPVQNEAPRAAESRVA